jgi:hypothetical protein
LLPTLAGKIKKFLHRRTSIESIISHLKNDHKIGRNYLKAVLEDSINPILTAAVFDFLKFARLEFVKIQLQRKCGYSTKHITPARRKVTNLPFWREDNSLFKKIIFL